jgi:hypothetical protein
LEDGLKKFYEHRLFFFLFFFFFFVEEFMLELRSLVHVMYMFHAGAGEAEQSDLKPLGCFEIKKSWACSGRKVTSGTG